MTDILAQGGLVIESQLQFLNASEMLPKRPDISVLIPVYNNPHTLKRAVRSVVEQPGVKVEIIIIDDASTDRQTAEAMKSIRDERLAVRDPTRIFKMGRHVENRRIAETLNTAAAVATGQYIIRLDSDDWFEHGSLVRLKAALDANPKAGFAYGKRKYYGRRSDTYTPAPFEREQFNRYNASGYCYMFRRDVWDMGIRWEALGTFGGAVIDLEDWQHIHKMLNAGLTGLTLTDTLVLHYTFRWDGTWQELQNNQTEALAEFKRRFPSVTAESL